MAAPGLFTLSIDLELAWGEAHRPAVGIERLLAARAALPELLRLLERHRVPATFAVVGHLLLEGCDGHPDLPRPPHDPWLERDPKGDERGSPAWYAPSLVRAIAAAAPGHDIGAHGFRHLFLDGPGVTLEVARAEVAAAAAQLRQAGHEARAFVFPRNRISYREVLSEQGFTCYRGSDGRAYRRAPAALARACHLAEQALALRPPVARPRRDGKLVESSGSMLFLSREGLRRLLPMANRVRRAFLGLARAAREGSAFHLWLHAEDIVPDTGAMLAGLSRVLAEVERRRERGEIETRTMAELEAAGTPGVAA
jgi:hypothetical protein